MENELKPTCPKCHFTLEFQSTTDTLDDTIVDIYICPRCKTEVRFIVATTEE